MERFWKTIATVLISVVVTGVGAWLTLGQKAVDAQTVRQMIATESPYVQDKRLVEQALIEIQQLRREVAALSATVAKIEERTR